MLAFNPEFELKKAIKNNSLVVFAGAGTSKNAGYPDWKKLVHLILDEIEVKRAVTDFKNLKSLMDKNILNPLQVLDILKENGCVDVILEVIDKQLHWRDNIDLELHRKIIQLTPKVITSNYDKCFETALGPSSKVFDKDDPFSLWKLKDANHYIFKIHGDVGQPSNCILFSDQYEKLYAEEAFWFGFMNLLMNSTVLFIGFSLSDPYVNSVLFQIKKMYGGLTNKHFLITTDKGFENHELKDIIVPIIIKDYKKDLGKKLDELIPIISNLPARSYKEVIRTEKVAEIMQVMKNNTSVVVIKGETGIGKKSLAFEIGYAGLQQSSITLNNRVRFNNVIWISSTDIKNSSNYLNSIFDMIGVAFGSQKITKMPAEKIWMKDWEVYKLLQESSTLMIFDSFECINEPEDFFKWVQKLPENCKIILTTTKDIPIPNHKVELSGLTREEAVRLITNEISEISRLRELSEDDINNLVTYTNGNPSALQLSVGEINKGILKLAEIKKTNHESTNRNSLEQHYERSWGRLSENAKKFLQLFAVFSNFKSIYNEALLEVCTSVNLDFEAVSKECDELNFLMIIEGDQRCHVPQATRTFIQQKLSVDKEKLIRDCWIKYFIEFIKPNVEREKPNEPYWNALVSDKMKALKKNWNGISEMLNWVTDDEGYDDLLIKLASLLVHYLDSRFYNQLRLKLVSAAIAAAQRSGKVYEEALFRIDALGWTYIEESSLSKAKEEIESGLSLADHLNHSDPVKSADLIALGNAWLARVEIEQDRKIPASIAIKKALEYTGKPWILYRVHMAAGDFFVHEKKYDDALSRYESAKQEYDLYEGEGQDYQINPRIALAYLRNGRLEEAKEILLKQINEEIPIGNLYAHYGLALINHKLGKKEEAIQKLNEIEKEIYSRASSNVLLKFIKTFREEEMLEPV